MNSSKSSDPVERLAALARSYQQQRESHGRQGPGGTIRRRLAQDMDALADSFERALKQWVAPELRSAWRDHFYRGASLPEIPALPSPPLFRGRTQSSALIEIPVASDGGYDVYLDGVHTMHHEIPWHLDPELHEPIQIGEWTCEEIFATSDAAAMALQDFLTQPGLEPPVRWARDLYEDGIVDADFALTDRGKRRLARLEPETRAAGRVINYCVLVANGGRARILTLGRHRSGDESAPVQLQEIADISNQEQRTRDSEQFANTRPGLRREGPHGPRHAVSDRRKEHRREAERRFLTLVADEAEQIWSRFRGCTIVVVASPRVLGLLRPIMADKIASAGAGTHHDISELPRDLTKFATPAVHSILARAGILPAAERLPPTRPMRTANPWQT